MAAGIGEASAIIAVVEIGLSLANALNTYVASVAAAPDDISNLSSEIDATLSHLRGLESLIQKNKETRAWDDDGLELAKRCIADCERIVNKLRSLLRKANWKDKEGVDKKVVDRSEIDLSKFERALWPRLKPELQICKDELQGVKLNIILAHNSYMIGTVSTETEKKKYREAIQSLSQARKLNTKRVKNAREGRRRPDFFDATGKLTLSGYPHMEHEFKVELQKAFERFLDNEAEKEEEESRILLMTEEKKRQEAEEETRKKIEQEAIKEYLEKAAKAEAEVQKKRDELKKKLRERPGLTQQQIEFIVEDVHPTNHNHAALLMQVAQGSEEQPTKAPMATSTTIESNNASFQKVSRTLSFRNIVGKFVSKKQVEPSISTTSTLPSAWRDPATKTGFARLESWYISEATSLQGGGRTPAPLPHSWMIKALMEAEKDYYKGRRKSKSFKPVWEVLPLLSPYLIQQINDLVTERKERGNLFDWSIVLIDIPEKSEIRRSVKIGPFKFHLEDEKPNVDGIYIILKYEEKSVKSPGVIFVGSRGGERSRSRSPDSAASEGSNTRHRRSSIPKQERERVRPRSIARRMSSTSRPSHINHLPAMYSNSAARGQRYPNPAVRVASVDDYTTPPKETYHSNRYREPEVIAERGRHMTPIASRYPSPVRYRSSAVARPEEDIYRPNSRNVLPQRDTSHWGRYTTSPERVADYTDIRIERGDRRPVSVMEPRISENYYSYSETSDDDLDIDIRHARQRNSRERERVRYSNQRQTSPLRSRNLRATVVDEDDEVELLSSGGEIADRLITKHTRPLANSGSSSGNTGVVEHLNINGEGANQQPTALSDITEEDEKASNGKGNAETKEARDLNS